MTALRRWAAPLLLLALFGCHRAPVENPRPDMEVLTQQQMLERNFINVYEAVAALRANWLSPRGTDSFSTPSQVWVYQDSNKLGGIETLSSVPVRSVVYVRHYNGIDATARWGVGHSAGVIFLSTHE